MRFYLAALLLLASGAFAAAPTISGAVPSGSTYTITGTNFGSKSPAAPIFFQPFTALSNGATPTDAGFDTWINYGGESVTNSDGVGGGSLHVDVDASNNAFTHIGKRFTDTNDVHVLLYFKISGSGCSSCNPQLKFVRAGVNSGGTGVDDYASNDVKFYTSLFGYGSATVGGNGTLSGFRSSAGEIGHVQEDHAEFGSVVLPEGDQVEAPANAWVFGEVYYKLNTYLGSDGINKVTINGQDRVYANAISGMRTAPTGENLSFVQPIPSFDLSTDHGATQSDFDWYLSRILIDSGLAHVFLSNSSTAAGVTQKFVLPATVWSTVGATVTDASNIPSGYKYLYVVNSGGEVNSAGFDISAGSINTLSVAWTDAADALAVSGKLALAGSVTIIDSVPNIVSVTGRLGLAGSIAINDGAVDTVRVVINSGTTVTRRHRYFHFGHGFGW